MDWERRFDELAAYASTLGKAKALVRSGGVLSCEVEPGAIEGSVRLSGTVRSSQPGLGYQVEVRLDIPEGDVVDFFCSCPMGDGMDGMCKHQMALALSYLQGIGQIDVTGGARTAAARPPRAVPSSPQIVNLIDQMTIQRAAKALRSRAKVDRANPDDAAPMEPVELLVSFSPSEVAQYSSGSDRAWLLKLRVRSGKVSYVVKNVAGLVRAYLARDRVSYGKRLAFVHEPQAFTERARAVLDLLARVVRSQQALYNSRWNYQGAGRGADVKELPLSDADIVDLLDIQQGTTVEFDRGSIARSYAGYYGGSYGGARSGSVAPTTRTLTVATGDPEVAVRLEPGDGGAYRLVLSEGLICIAGPKGLYVLDSAHAWRCSDEYARTASEVLPALLSSTVSMTIGSVDLPEFCRSVLPGLTACAKVDAPSELFALVPPDPEFTFTISLEDGEVVCHTQVAYGDRVLGLYTPPRSGQPPRDMVAEYHVQDVLEAYFPFRGDERAQDGLAFDESDDELLFHLLTEGLADLDELGEVRLSERLRAVRVRPAPTIRVKATVKSNLLDVAIDSSGLSPADLRAYLESFKRKQRFVRLSSGDIVKMGEELQAVEDLAEGLGTDITDLADGVEGLPQSRALFVDALLKKAEGVRLNRSADFRSIVREFETFSDADIEMPPSLEDTLRSYQVTGVRWLGTLERFGFGGILADDMGLGKTLQVIGHILSRKQARAVEDGAAADAARAGADTGEQAAGAQDAPKAAGESDSRVVASETTPETTLIVAPASLVYNWTAEIARFAPELDTVAVVGGKKSRERIIAASAEHDVLVTSYDLMRRDVEAYAAQRYRRVVLDEAQYIKNPGTRAAKCAKCLPSDVRFALTGTPIENRLTELWSIFDFLMPGALGTHDEFRKRFESPVEHGEHDATRQLQCLVAPFILRRLKADVLGDLPDKTESVVLARMGAEQEKLYRANQDRIAMQVQHRLPDEFKREKLKVLAELTRLRQICCDPRLCFENYSGGSAKLDTCVELVRNAVDAGHGVLMFSQFTGMLDLLGERLGTEHIEYLQLTGATSKEERARLVSRFQAGDVKVFLISLKAGGVGLNLTAADVVIHYDPWWNLAAQNQATDRAHRIGQQRAVSVFKLIAQGTLEEKIVEMQARKHDLAEAVLGGEALSSARLTQEDVLALLGV